MNDYSPEKIKGYIYLLVVIDNFSKFAWLLLLKNKYAPSITDAFSQIIKTSKRKPYLLETDDGEEYVNRTFHQFLNNKNNKRHSRYTDKGVVFEERFNKTIHNLIKKLMFGKG